MNIRQDRHIVICVYDHSSAISHERELNLGTKFVDPGACLTGQNQDNLPELMLYARK